MFLAIPVMWAFAMFWYAPRPKRWDLPIRIQNILFIVLLLIGLSSVLYKHLTYTTALNHIMQVNQSNKAMQVARTEPLYRYCQQLSELSQKYDANLLIIPQSPVHAINYALPVLSHGRIETLFPGYERRTWRLEAEAKLIRPRILISLEEYPQLILEAQKYYKSAQIISVHPTIMCLEPEGQTAIQVCKKLGITVRNFE